ncbi:glycosyltransferase family 4 protein [Cyclobacterium sp. SYSU L10401]|uniref:glycosyltransferase family 4 protein n=1 Tax=Cyclobacterium sp. SYSU L10401 TaxID=2678657 RepID=UPI0013D0964D|nr:glycosyltransferase family 4 protein [Cyclobacterium sp. SYSU L10401]
MGDKEKIAKTVVHVMGFGAPKYGALERYILDLSKTASLNKIKIVVIYNRMPKSEEFLQDLKDNKIAFYIAKAHNPLKFLPIFFKIIMQYKPSIIHSHFQPLWPGIFGYLFGCKNRWNTIHLMLVDKDIKEATQLNQLKITSRIHRMLVNKFNTRFFSVSNAVNNQFKAFYPSQVRKFEVLYNGVQFAPIDKEVSRVKLGFCDDTLYICCVAFASKTKGVDILIDAMNQLYNMNKDRKLKLCLIGLMQGDNMTNKLMKRVESYGLEDMVINFGIINNVTEVLPAMDIYVQPSRSESLSNAIIEAGFAGVPAIGSNVGGIPEVIIENETGFLFPVGDYQELAKKIDLLIKNDDLRREMGIKAKQHKIDNFLMADKIDRLIDYYKSTH